MNVRTARRAAQLKALGIADTRGNRFANRMAGVENPTFTDLAAVPRWLMLPTDAQRRVAMAAGLLRYKDAIDRELSGQKLAAIVDMVGEAMFDAVASRPIEETSETNLLPPPETLVAEGWAILHRSLPAPFSIRFPNAANDAKARALAEVAFDLVQRL